MSIYKAESKYVKNNVLIKIFGIISGLVGIFVVFLLSGSYGREVNIVQFVREQYMGYIILAFIVPFQYANYFCSNFETGSIKNIVASGNSRTSFVITKFLKQASSAIKCVIWYSVGVVLIFISTFMIVRNNITFVGFSMYFVFEIFLKNIILCILLIYFSALILLFSMIFKKETVSSLLTLFMLVADIVTTLRLSQSDAYTHIKTNLYFYKLVLIMEDFRFADQTFADGIQNFFGAIIIPIIITVILLGLSVLVFEKKDIVI